ARHAARGISERARRRGGRAGAAGRRQAEVVAAGDVTPPRTRIALVDPRRPEAPVLEEAAAVLRGGGLVAFPTETFYGLGAPALDRAAVRRVFELKGRPETKPLLVLVDSLAMAERVGVFGPAARALAARHWPGALTLVVAAGAHVPEEVTAGTGTIGVRVSPDHGALGGIYSGLRAAPGDAAFTVACDMPFLHPDVVRLVVARADEGDVVIPRVGGQWETLHAAYAKSCLPHIEARLVAGRL